MSSHGRAFSLTYMTGIDTLTDSYSATKNIFGLHGKRLRRFAIVKL